MHFLGDGQVEAVTGKRCTGEGLGPVIASDEGRVDGDGLAKGDADITGPVAGDDVAAVHEKLVVGEVVGATDAGTHLGGLRPERCHSRCLNTTRGASEKGEDENKRTRFAERGA